MRTADYILKRSGVAVSTIFAAVTFNFVLFRLAPGSVVDTFARIPNAGDLRDVIAKQFGLDEPYWAQYGLYLRNVVTGNFGLSYQNRRPVLTNIGHDLANTIPMVLIGTVLAIVVGGTIGVVAAARSGSKTDHFGVGGSMLLYSLPPQWVGLVLVVLLGGVLPSSGITDYFAEDPSFWDQLGSQAIHIILPSLTFALTLFGQFVLIMRASVLDTLSQDYILTARAKGLSRWAIVRRHALRNAALPGINQIAISLGYVVGGAILVEVVFSWPGVGLAIYQAVAARDYPMLQGLFLVLAVSVVLANFCADLLALWLDPRVRT